MNKINCDCGHSEIVADFEDKKGWLCEKCRTVWEIDIKGGMVQHLFHTVRNATFDHSTALTTSRPRFRTICQEDPPEFEYRPI